MLMIYTQFELIRIPEHTQCCIYIRDHPGEVCGYGDLIIDTPERVYTFHRVQSAYDYCAKLNMAIWEAEEWESVRVDLNALNDVRGFHAEGGFEVWRK